MCLFLMPLVTFACGAVYTKTHMPIHMHRAWGGNISNTPISTRTEDSMRKGQASIDPASAHSRSKRGEG